MPASEQLKTRIKNAYAAERGLVALWREEFKPADGIKGEVERLQKIVEGTLDGMLEAMGLEVPEDGT